MSKTEFLGRNSSLLVTPSTSGKIPAKTPAVTPVKIQVPVNLCENSRENSCKNSGSGELLPNPPDNSSSSKLHCIHILKPVAPKHSGRAVMWPWSYTLNHAVLRQFPCPFCTIFNYFLCWGVQTQNFSVARGPSQSRVFLPKCSLREGASFCPLPVDEG